MNTSDPTSTFLVINICEEKQRRYTKQKSSQTKRYKLWSACVRCTPLRKETPRHSPPATRIHPTPTRDRRASPPPRLLDTADLARGARSQRGVRLIACCTSRRQELGAFARSFVQVSRVCSAGLYIQHKPYLDPQQNTSIESPLNRANTTRVTIQPAHKKQKDYITLYTKGFQKY